MSDGLQLGRTTIDQTDIQAAEDDISKLKNEVAEVRDGWMETTIIDSGRDLGLMGSYRNSSQTTVMVLHTCTSIVCVGFYHLYSHALLVFHLEV